MLKRVLLNPTSPVSGLIIFLIVVFINVYIFAFRPPFVVNIIFVVLCVIWAAWTFISIFRGTDELVSSSVRYGLAAASAVGAPLSLAFVMMVVAIPALQNLITIIATSSPLSPAAAGFGLGVTFAILVMCAVLIISYSLWWISKR